MKNEVNRSFMDKKKNYNQPKTEIAIYCVANVMLTVSNGGTPPNEDPAHAPGRKGDIIP